MIKKELLEKFRKMSHEELQSYLSMTGLIREVCMVLGVSSILLFLYFMGPITAIITVSALYFFGRLSVNADHVREHIFEILALQNRDK